MELWVLPGWIEVLEWIKCTEGIRILELGRNLMASPKSQRTRCPPRSRLNLPNAVIEHQPCARVFSFQCGKVMTCSPRLNKRQGNVPTLPLYYLHSCTFGSVALLCFLHKSSTVFHMYSSWKNFPQISESSLRALQDRDWGQWGVNRWNTCTTCKRA